MPRSPGKNRASSSRRRKVKSRKKTNVSLGQAPPDLTSLIRGLYARVASRLKIHPSYVSRVARRERRSKAVEDALRAELMNIVEQIQDRGVRVLGQDRSEKSRCKKISPQEKLRPN